MEEMVMWEENIQERRFRHKKKQDMIDHVLAHLELTNDLNMDRKLCTDTHLMFFQQKEPTSHQIELEIILHNLFKHNREEGAIKQGAEIQGFIKFSIHCPAIQQYIWLAI